MVEGDISPFGFSDRYLRQDNPFREGEKESFKGGTKVAVIAPVVGRPPGLCRSAAKPMAVKRESTCARLRVARGLGRRRPRIANASAKCMSLQGHGEAKRLCDPKNFVTNPNEYGWGCHGSNESRAR